LDYPREPEKPAEFAEPLSTAAAPLSAKLVKGAKLKIYPGFPHGMPTTNADQINADLLAFLQQSREAAA